MPIYEYECQACGRQMEAQQRITEPPLVDCPACNQPRLQRLISATSFSLKGGGWYKDGYGSSSTDKKPRTENDRIDRLQKAVDDDKKKTAAESGSTDSGGGDAAPAPAPATTTPSSGGGGGSSTT